MYRDSGRNVGKVGWMYGEWKGCKESGRDVGRVTDVERVKGM